MRYFGLPLSGARLSTANWQPVIEVERCLEGWQANVIEVLLNSVLSATPIFYISIFQGTHGHYYTAGGLDTKFFVERKRGTGSPGYSSSSMERGVQTSPCKWSGVLHT